MELETCSSAPLDWARVSIADACSTFTSGGTPSRRNPAYYRTGSVPWVKTKELHDTVLNDAEEWITEVAVSESSAKRLPAQTVLMAMYGATVGKLGVLGRVMACNQACAAMVADQRKCDYRFLYYQLLANRRQIVSMATGAAQQNLSGRQIKDWLLPLPALDEQREIVDLLWSLDRRIDNLRATNATLEAIAQALFKSWFVDFDPVHAKAEGRAPAGMDAATAALFPSGFEDSDLGPIPKGWAVTTLSEHVDADRGLSYKGAGLAEPGNGLPMHNLNSVLEGGGYKYAGIKYYAGPYKAKHLVQAGDIIVANTEQGHEYRLIGFPAIVPASYPAALFSHHLYRVRAKTASPITKEWLYQCLMVPTVRDQIVSCANGSTVNMLKVVGLEIPRFVLPPRSACQAFEDLVRPMRQQFEANVGRTDTLTSLRDTLLPRLISGKLRLLEVTETAETALA